jgi:hypothetical protein
VHGNKGIYELVYFIKDSKPLHVFKKQALGFNKIVEGKTHEEIETLVRKFILSF